MASQPATSPKPSSFYKEVRDKGFDSLFFVNSLAQHIRDLMVAADARTVSLLETPADVSERLVKQSGALPLPGITARCGYSTNATSTTAPPATSSYSWN